MGAEPVAPARMTGVTDSGVVQDVFGTVVFVVCAVGIVGAVAGLLLNRRTWEQYGADHLLLESDHARRPGPGGAGISTAERDAEIRQMLEARNARRRRRGEAEVDIEDELRRLTATTPAIDDALRAEIRDLVIARNHRRARRGEPPLDVETEIEREIAGLAEL